MIETSLDVDAPTPPPSDQDDVAACDQTRGARAHDTGLGIPRALWSAPVAEARWCRVRPSLSPRLLHAPVLAWVAAYVSAVCAARGHVPAAGWLLALAVIAILSGAAAVAVHVRRCVGYRTAAPREEFR